MWKIKFMQLFYSPNIQNNIFELNEEETRHCYKVLRLNVGDNINITDGNGNLFIAKLIHLDKNKGLAEIIETKTLHNQRNFYLHIAIAPTKNADRIEWFVEKVTEIGIDEITLLECEHSERSNYKIERLEKILVSAMKQSIKTFKPKLNKSVDCLRFINEVSFEGTKFIAHCEDKEPKKFIDIYAKNTNVLVLIGPEGDFSKKEINAALNNNYTALSLGNSRLRTETAGMVACEIFNFYNELI